MKRILFLFLILASSLKAQHSKVVLEANGQFGTIFKHSSKFIPDITQFTYNVEAGVSVRNFGDKAWQQKLHYPEVGVSLIHSQFGDDDVFGHGTGLFPHVKFFINRNKIADMYFRLGTGMAYISKPYDRISNSENNVIGSKFNNITQLRLGADFHLSPRMDFAFALNFTHFSNAKVQSPNLGINIPAFVAGIRYNAGTLDRDYISGPIPEPEKRNEYLYRFSVGVNDRGIGGPKYPIYIHSFHYARYTSVANKVWVGTSVAMNMGEYDFIRIQEISTHKSQLSRSMDWSIYVGDEILLGNVGVFFLVGAYLIDPEFPFAPIYAKLGANYYFYEFGEKDHKLFLGVNLKTHYSVAEFVEMSAGIAF